MKHKITIALIAGVLPTVALAAQPDQCALQSTCSFNIRGKFNKELMTSQLQAGKIYICTVVRGSGRLLSVKNVTASKGVRYDLKGRRLNKPFIIHGPRKGTGHIRYTIYNNNDPWRSNSIQFKCKLVSMKHSL